MSIIYEQNIESSIFPKYNIALFSINLFLCFTLLNLWISLIKFNKEKKCYCGGCCSLKSSETNETGQIIPINPEEKTKIEIFFDITSGGKIKIIVPSSTTVKKLFEFFFEAMEINKTDEKHIYFIKDANKLKIDSNNLVKNEFGNNNHVLVIDLLNIIHSNEYLFIYQ